MAERGRLALEAGSFQTALDQLNMAIALQPMNPKAFALRGETYRQIDQLDEAVADFDHAIALRPKMASVIAWRGMTYQLKGDYERALADFDRAIEIDPKYVWAVAQRGIFYRMQKQYDLALADLDQAIRIDSESAWAIVERGVTYREKGEYDHALADFNRAIQLAAKSAWAFAQRGETCREKGEYASALADFDQAIALNPKYTWATIQKGIIYLQMGQYERAAAYFNQFLAAGLWDGQDLAALRGLLRLLNRDYGQALADLDQAIALKRDDGTLFLRALTYRLLGQDDAAQQDLAEAIAQAEEGQGKASVDGNDKLSVAGYHLAAQHREVAINLYQRAIDAGIAEGRLREDITSLEIYLHLFPEDDLALELHTRLQRYRDERFPKKEPGSQ